MGVIKLDRFMQPQTAPSKTTLENSDADQELEYWSKYIWPIAFVVMFIVGLILTLQVVNTILISVLLFWCFKTDF